METLRLNSSPVGVRLEGEIGERMSMPEEGATCISSFSPDGRVDRFSPPSSPANTDIGIVEKAQVTPEPASKRPRECDDSVSRKGKRYEIWQQLRERADEDVRGYLDEYREKGFFIVRQTFSQEILDLLLEGKGADNVTQRQHRLSRSAHRARDCWAGAREMLRLNRCAGGGICALRGKGRYDLPLPPDIARRALAVLEEKSVMRIITSICPKARVRTANVMLSEPGSERQPIHTDSVWDGCAHKDPLPHYLTVLIPLTEQNQLTGGTRVWPGSHRDIEFPLTEQGQLDMIEPLLKTGDALIFDGLLSHCGLENKDLRDDRYFFYLAFSSRHDPNTDATGF
jgi:hypothetical protein